MMSLITTRVQVSLGKNISTSYQTSRKKNDVPEILIRLIWIRSI